MKQFIVFIGGPYSVDWGSPKSSMIGGFDSMEQAQNAATTHVDKAYCPKIQILDTETMKFYCFG